MNEFLSAVKKQLRWKKEEIPRILELKSQLIGLGEVPKNPEEVIPYAVSFFNVISNFQDDGYILYSPEIFQKDVELLNSHIRNSGRCVYGINRTQKGETVTLDNTFWGDVYGIWTFSSRQILEMQSVYPHFATRWLKNPSSYKENPEVKEVITDFQIIPFVNSHIPEILEICKTLTCT